MQASNRTVIALQRMPATLDSPGNSITKNRGAGIFQRARQWLIFSLLLGAAIVASADDGAGIKTADAPRLAVAPAPSSVVAAIVTYVTGPAYRENAGRKTRLAEGDEIREGDWLVTGEAGHIHLTTIDKGFISLRPRSRAQFDIYQYDPEHPEKTRIRLQLQAGVLRTVSGRGAESARQNFRLNTPVAAIGIHGTDFTVLVQNDYTRTIVNRGEIVVSGFGGACQPQALGPCTGENAQILTALQAGQILQIQRGQLRPVMLESSKNQGPDQVAPPAQTEPAPGEKDPGKQGKAMHPPAAADVRVLQPNMEPEVLAFVAQNAQKDDSNKNPAPPSAHINWGRWADLANAQEDLTTWLQKNGQLLGINTHYVMARDNADQLQMPQTGQYDFILDKAEARILDRGSHSERPASVAGGILGVDFGKQSFTTRLDVLADQQQFKLQASGRVSADGQLSGNYPYTDANTNTFVRGALAGPAATQAGYLFEHTLNDGERTITGMTTWKR